MKPIHVCFSRIQRALRSDLNRAMEDTGLSPAEVQALRYITFHKAMSQRELSEDMGIDKGATSRLVCILEEKGLVRREADPSDGRIKRIVPTEAAREIHERAVDQQAVFYDWLLEELTPEEAQRFRETLDLLYTRCSNKGLHKKDEGSK
jgi:DNA-binding MarR family transcriptional regulator